MREIGFNIVRSLTFIIPQLIIISACIYYLIKKITPEGILLILGSIIGLLGTIFHVIVLPYLRQNNIIDPINGHLKLLTFVGAINLIASLAFSTGFLILIINIFREKKVILQKDILD